MEEPRFGLPKVSPKTTAPEDALKEIIKLNPGGMIVEDLLECMFHLGYGRTKSKEVLKQQVENGVFKKIDHATDSRCKIVIPNEIDDQLSNPNLIAIKWRDDKVIVRGKFQYITKHYEGYNSSSTS
ncbi:MAG: hypothetical protein KGL95_06245, partial [Patescibacteria group bacterium]|nr:hypothetical protein [Patescibacteria group bacterium]